MKDLIRQGARFGLVGLGATLVHLAVAWIASHWIGLGDYIANGAGFVVAFWVSYFGHSHWTFEQERRDRRSLLRFVVVALLGYAMSNVIVWLVTDVFEASFDMALVAILFVVPPTTWIISRIWAFAPAKGA